MAEEAWDLLTRFFRDAVKVELDNLRSSAATTIKADLDFIPVEFGGSSSCILPRLEN